MIIIHGVKLYTYEETAQILAVPIQTVYNYTKAKQLKTTALHGKKYLSEPSIINYVNGTVHQAGNVASGRILYGFSVFTNNWKDRRQQFAEFCAEDWRRKGTYEHMQNEYINTDTPITLRLYDVDADTRKLIYSFVCKLTGQLADLTI